MWANMLRSVFLLTHAKEDGLVDVNVRLKRHHMALNGAACNDGTSWNNKMQESEDREMNGKWNEYKNNKTLKKKHEKQRDE